MPTCSAGCPPLHTPQFGHSFGVSTESKNRKTREFYKEYSRKHPPKNHISLLQRENDRMASLREQRSGRGYSEKFLSRRHFPIVDSPPVEEMDSPPDSPDEEAKKTLSF